ncbi:ABC transporter permease [Variovorax sp. WS11]|uniref:amino acid ABC transporter permease n=1 Tax=Variovorax sp. WS11 TaxID=1105204 RepID=UPI000D0DB11E|nr:amino acid ABC transporter permease [Variovorax sp. WS11]NDZ14797.1 amino acid ABC transporter permease [Variovorax sp. WS11]PSL85682.1 ABC transporter permease [Variovorax sp. WS11]
MNYDWDFGAVWAYRQMLLEGALGTMRIAAVAILMGVVIGALLATMRLSKLRWLAYPALWFTEFYRNTPPLVHFFWAFYALPVILGVSLDPYAAAIIALSTQSGAFYAEVFRGGVISVERGQWEGARALGMKPHKVLRRVVLPQALQRMLPPFMERSFELIKTTALASTLAYSDLLYQAMQVNSITFRPLEVYTFVAGIFFITLLALSMLAHLLESRLSRASYQTAR